jgi:serine/threonine protein kinase
MHGRWLPIVKMEWVDGISLDAFVRKHIWHREQIANLSANFKQMCIDLKKAGIAHGDLQHGNIMITPEGELRLVDYDGMFVPELAGFPSNEIGHRNYQHPARDREFFNERLDNFSAWSIYSSLSCLSIDTSLVDALSGCDECLLFRQADYKYPLNSHAFYVLEHHKDPQIVETAKQLRATLDCPLQAIPFLDDPPPDTAGLPPVVYKAPVITGFKLPEWISDIELASASLDAAAVITPETWPKLVDYIRAITHPRKAFSDPRLQEAVLALDKGQIKAFGVDSGAVFRVHMPDGSDCAVKMYLQFDPDLEERHRRFHDYVFAGSSETAKLRTRFVDFEFMPEGVRIGTQAYPVLLMPWQNGMPLFDFLSYSRYQKANVKGIANEFVEMMTHLQQLGVIHGELNADNILIVDGNLKLVDYDKVRVPTSRSLISPWAPNPNFRHPLATRHGDELTDNFAAWIIYTSLIMLANQPDLWNQLNVRHGRLLFSREDYKDPASSSVFRAGTYHYAESVRLLTKQLLRYLKTAPNSVPPLTSENLPQLRSFWWQSIFSPAT